MTRLEKKRLQSHLTQAIVKVRVYGSFKGTGFFITPDGSVLTAFHCIGEGAQDITLLTASGESLPARLDKSFPREDLAVLKVDFSPVQCLPLGTVVHKEDRVLGLGYPAGDRADNPELGFYPGTVFKFREDSKIETDAVRGEGQSGGPVYHYASRRVVGVVSGGYLPERLVFTGLATRLEPLFAAWPELPALTADVAQTWDKTMQSYGTAIVNRERNVTIIKKYGVSEERLEALSEEFGVTKSAIKSFFKILGQEAVPLEDLDKTLRDIANRYKEMLKSIQSLESTDDPQVTQLLKQAQQFLAGENAEGKEISIDFDQAEKALKLAFEREKEAIQELEKAEKKIQARKDKKRLSAAGIKAQEAELNFTRLRYLAAGEAYQEAAEFLPEGHEKELGRYLNNAGSSFCEIGQYEKALPLYQQSLAIRKKVLGKEHPNVAESLSNLAMLYGSQGQYDKALPLYQQSLAIRKKVLGEEHPDVALSLNNLAMLYGSQGQYDKALPLVQQSLAIRKKVLGEKHPDVAVSLNNLAELYRSQGQYEKALPLVQQSLAIRKKVLGEEHPDVATSLNNLAMLYQSQGQYDKALPLSQQSLAIIEKVLGKEHPDTKTIAENFRNIQRHLVSPAPFQIIVKKVLPDSRAAQLGIQVGDVLTHYAGQPIRGVESFIYGRSQEPIGGEAKELQVLRGDKVLKFMISPGKIGVELREEEKAIDQIK